MYDVAVIGGGIGGYTAALRARELGKQVVLIEKNKDNLGGLCLNQGCIPTKFYAQSAHLLEKYKSASRYGITFDGFCQFNLESLLHEKKQLVTKLRMALESFLRSKGVEILFGSAVFKSNNEINVLGDSIEALNILIATGSKTRTLPAFATDGKYIFDSSQLLELSTLPKSLVVMGGGVIGCEFASIFSQFGCDVTIIEKEPTLLPTEDQEIAKRLGRIFKKKGIEVFTDTTIQSIEKENENVKIGILNKEDFIVEKVLVSVGRMGMFEGLSIDNAGVATNNGWIQTDDYMQTSIANIYAVGDCAGKYFYAHSASHAGTIAIDNMFLDKKRSIALNIPRCVFTSPQISSVGSTEQQLKEQNRSYEVVKVPFQKLGIVHVVNEVEGIAKLLVSPETKTILGAHFLGGEVVDLITMLTFAIENKISIDKLKHLICVHPTRSEIIQESFQLADLLLNSG